MQLNTIKDNKGARKSLMRVGRGMGSGKGKTSGRGHKGQKSRSGVSIKGIGFEGGQTPIFRRLPKRGFNNSRFETVYTVINLKDIQNLIDAKLISDKLNAEILKKTNFASNILDGIKVLGVGELKSAITIEAAAFSKTAEAAITKAGGKIVCTRIVPVEGKKQKLNKEKKTTRLEKKQAAKQSAK